MGLLERLDRWMFPQTEQHAIDKMALWGTGEDFGEPVHAGVLVSQESALRFTVVWRCIQLISGTLASLPWDAVRKRDGIPEPVDRPASWLDTPNPETNIFEFKERVCESLLMDGNAFVLITQRDGLGFPVEIWTLHPHDIQVRTRDNGTTFFLWKGTRELSRFGPTNPTGDVLHVKLSTAGGLRGMSPIEAARQSIGLGLVTEKFGARFFGAGQTLSGVLEFESSAQGVTQKNIDLTKANWKRKHAGSDRSHEPGILVGAKWKPMSINPEEAQFLETRKFQVEDIAARIYGVPAHLVGLEEKNTSWGTGIEAQTRGFLTFTLAPHIVRLETAFSQLLPRGQSVNLNTKAFLRTDAKTEAEVLAIQHDHGVIDPNEWRARIDLPPKRQPATPTPSGNGQMPVEVTP